MSTKSKARARRRQLERAMAYLRRRVKHYPVLGVLLDQALEQ